MPLHQTEFELLRGIIREHCGIQIGDDKSYLIESRLAHLLVEHRCATFTDLYRKIAREHRGPLCDQVVDAITTHETLWFRDGGPWDLLRQVILPDFIARLAAGRPTRVRCWSAACSTGQEPYSLALLLDDLLHGPGGRGVRPDRFEILGTDISKSALTLAAAGRYNQIAMARGLNESHRQRYFTSHGHVWELREAVRRRVVFQPFNLKDAFERLGPFDLILCRNVTIYFAETLKADVYRRLSATLAPQGYLILGASESLLGYATDFELHQHKKHLYYRRRARKETPP